ncbi:MAG: replicative DNA helicase [Gammaproteobacteria bacterium]
MTGTAKARRDSVSVVDVRTPPHSVEAEQSVLGGLLIDPNAWDNVGDVIRANDFYRPDHRLIFEAIAALAAEAKPYDLITVSEALARIGKLDAAGGVAYLGTLSHETPTAANVRAYAEIVRERALLRLLIQTGTDIAASALSNEGETARDLVERAEQQIFEIAEQGTRRSSPLVPARDLLPPLIDKIDEWNRNPSSLRGLPTGFVDFDRKTGGLRGGDLIIIAGRPSMGKCIVSGSRILNPQTGALEMIDTLVQERRAQLVSLDTRGRLRPAEASDFVDDGVKPVYELRTALGRRVVVTASHPFLTPSGWQPLAALRAGVHIAVPRVLPFFGHRKLPDSLVKLTAYFLTDGGLTDTVPKFTNARPRVLEDFVAAVGHFPGMRCRIETSQGTRTATANVVRDLNAIGAARRAFGERFQRTLRAAGWALHALARALGVTPAAVYAWKAGMSAPAAALLPRLSALGLDISSSPGSVSIHKNGDNPVTQWLVTLGLWGKSAHTKRVPDVIFELLREQLALFLNRAFACDGSIYVQNDDQPAISYSTVSEPLARDIQHLLLRFGIIAKLRFRQIRYRDTRRAAFELRVVRQEDIARFVREIGMFGKELAAAKALRVSSAKRPKVNLDVIPRDIWALIVQKKGERTWSDLAAALGLGENANLHVGKRGLSRPRLRRIAELLGDADLADVASSDIYWDRIEAIDYVGERQVYDLTVPVHRNFVAEDVVVHNTTLAVNMAENAALDQKTHASVAIFSMEMPADQLLMRMMASLGRVPLSSIRNGRMSDEDWVRLTGATQQLGGSKIFIDETPALTPTELRARARRIKREHDLHLVVVDYLQLMSVPGTQENRATEIAEVSRGLKALAKELKVPVIALSQLNRAVEQREHKKPVMSDLRESGAIEQEADMILLIYRDEVYNKDTPKKGEAEIDLAKHRNGETGSIRLTFRGEITKFESYQDPAYAEGILR